jgi:cell division protein FtsZ
MIALKEEEAKQIVSIKVIGVGGAGGNAVKRIIDSGIHQIDCIVVNTDAQALDVSTVPTKIQIGVKSAKGLGTGANPELGKRAAEEDLDKIMEVVGSADIVFLAAGMGGGTGSGALPVIAHALREKGILTIAIITKPFIFEGKRRMNVAQEATEVVRKEVDTLIIMPNQNLLQVADKNVSMIDAFAMINDVLTQSVKGISDIITNPGHINVDCADVRAIMKDQGIAVMGTGKALGGSGRGREAALQAITSPLLENMSIEGAHSVLLNITGGKNLGLHDISDAASVIYEQAHEDANIILGSVIDEAMGDEISVTIIATGFKSKEKKEVAPASNDKTPARNEQPQTDTAVRPSVLDSYGLGFQALRKAQDTPAVEVVAAPVVVVAPVIVAAPVAAHVVVEAQQEEEIILSEEDAELERELALLDAAATQAAASFATKEAAVEHAMHDIAHEHSQAVEDLDVPTYLRKQQEDRI